MSLKISYQSLALMFLLVMGIFPAAAQQVVTDDDVNAVAKKLYCPVCENIPLDACGTAACDDWRYEIRLQLVDGKSEQAIIDDFVRRFGDRVVGTPQDPLLNALALLIPLVGVVLALIVALYVAVRNNRQKPAPVPAKPDVDKYQSMLEKDLGG